MKPTGYLVHNYKLCANLYMCIYKERKKEKKTGGKERKKIICVYYRWGAKTHR